MSNLKLLPRFLTVESILLDVQSSSQDDAFCHASQHLAPLSGVSSKLIYQALLAREKLGSTAIGDGVAIPHARIKGLDSCYCVLMRLAQPIEYETPDQGDVSLLFFLVGAESHPEKILEVWSELSQLCGRAQWRQMCRELDTPQAIHDQLVGSGST